jgi:predicted P-loop ATPase
VVALTMAPEWRDVLWYSEFAGAVFARRPFPGCPTLPGRKDLQWSDKWDTVLTCWLHEQGIMVSTDVAGKAVQSVAQERTFHPVKEYLSGLEWDGMPRLDNWLIEYCRAEAKHYTAAVGPRWMVSAVARIFEPGCQADSAIILEGEQGIRKSTALRVLGGEWFTDEISIIGSKDASIDTQGIWLIEISELDAFRAAEVSRIKVFMSRRWNRFRPPYGKHAIQFPRQCVFAATTNQDHYLPDETGNRRFWPVQCTAEIDIDNLAKDRDQLWAEAVWKYRDGFPVYLDDLDLVKEAQEEQAKRYESDVWEDRIADWLESKSDVSVTQILELCIAKPLKDCTQKDKIRVARCLRSLHWVKYRSGGDEARENRYRRSVASPKQTDIVW